MDIFHSLSVVLLLTQGFILIDGLAIDLLDVNSLEPVNPNYCNNSDILEEAGLLKGNLGQFLGYECSPEFYHCRWQSDGFRTYRKQCKTGLVYDVLGTQNCNYDYNVKSCGIRSTGPVHCNQTDFHCALSELCLPMTKRCDGHYDCSLEEDEQNCPLCLASEFACVVSEQCIPMDRRCNGIPECDDTTDERDCQICGHGLFHCGKSGECVPMDARCDGKRHCPHGEDEMLCKKSDSDKKFTCQSRDQQIPMTQVCDGLNQCQDGSDEMYCEVGIAAGSAISFSSNPAPAPEPYVPSAPVVQPAEEKEEEYEYDTADSEAPAAPSFPMLSLVSMPPPIVIQTTRATTRPTTTRGTPRTLATRPSTAPKAAFSKPKPRISAPQEAITPIKIVQPTYVEVTASPRPKAPATRAPSTLRPPASLVDSQGRKIRYPTVATDQVPEARATIIPSSVRPKSEQPTQMFARSSVPQSTGTSRTSIPTTASTKEHRVVVEVTSPPIGNSQADVKADILKQLSGQIQTGLSPDLMGKIERLLTDELDERSRARMIRRRPTGIRNAPLSPSALIRTFTSRVHNIEDISA